MSADYVGAHVKLPGRPDPAATAPWWPPPLEFRREDGASRGDRPQRLDCRRFLSGARDSPLDIRSLAAGSVKRLGTPGGSTPFRGGGRGGGGRADGAPRGGWVLRVRSAAGGAADASRARDQSRDGRRYAAQHGGIACRRIASSRGPTSGIPTPSSSSSTRKCARLRRQAAGYCASTPKFGVLAHQQAKPRGGTRLTPAFPLHDGTLTTPGAIAMIRALIPLEARGGAFLPESPWGSMRKSAPRRPRRCYESAGSMKAAAPAQRRWWYRVLFRGRAARRATDRRRAGDRPAAPGRGPNVSRESPA